jgi:hypothetical protein
MTISVSYYEINIGNWIALMFAYQEMRMWILATDTLTEGAFTPRRNKRLVFNLKDGGDIIFNH